MDWGLSARQDAPEEEEITGTPAYSPPEQLEGKAPDKRSDVYGIGATLYELLTLHPPHEGKDFMETFQRALTQEVAPADAEVRPLQGRVPKEIARIVRKALRRSPERRHQSPEELRQELQDYLDGEAPVVCVHTGAKRATNWMARCIDNYGRAAILALVFLIAFPWLMLAGVLLATLTGS